MRVKSLLLIVVVALAPIAFAADGAAVYKAKCASCHGADGKGLTPIGKKMNLRDLGSPEVQKQTDKELYDWTAVGKNKMPGYDGKIPESDLKAVIAHIRTLAQK